MAEKNKSENKLEDLCTWKEIYENNKKGIGSSFNGHTNQIVEVKCKDCTGYETEKPCYTPGEKSYEDVAKITGIEDNPRFKSIEAILNVLENYIQISTVDGKYTGEIKWLIRYQELQLHNSNKKKSESLAN